MDQQLKVIPMLLIRFNACLGYLSLFIKKVKNKKDPEYIWIGRAKAGSQCISHSYSSPNFILCFQSLSPGVSRDSNTSYTETKDPSCGQEAPPVPQLQVLEPKEKTPTSSASVRGRHLSQTEPEQKRVIQKLQPEQVGCSHPLDCIAPLFSLKRCPDSNSRSCLSLSSAESTSVCQCGTRVKKCRGSRMLLNFVFWVICFTICFFVSLAVGVACVPWHKCGSQRTSLVLPSCGFRDGAQVLGS